MQAKNSKPRRPYRATLRAMLILTDALKYATPDAQVLIAQAGERVMLEMIERNSERAA